MVHSPTSTSRSLGSSPIDLKAATLSEPHPEALVQLLQREKLLNAMAQRIRQSLQLEDVLQTAVTEVRQLLQTDRVLLYRFNEDWSGAVVVESVESGWQSLLNQEIQDTCFQHTFAPLYRTGRVRAIEDIHIADLASCHIELLQRCQVRANLVIPVLHHEHLWGLLIAHHCCGTRAWQDWEVELLQQLSVQLAISLQQAELLQQTQQQAEQLAQTLQTLSQTQMHLIQAEKLSSLGQLVAGVAHEINNPVNFIHGNLTYVHEHVAALMQLIELYQQACPQPGEAVLAQAEDLDLDFIREDLPKILTSMQVGTDRIQEIVLSLRNFSRLDEAERKAVNLHKGIDSTLMILQHRLKATAERPAITVLKAYGDLPLVECYAGPLNQVFMNLLSNAIDALEEHWSACSSQGRVDFAPTLTIETEVVDAAGVALRFIDNGPGLSEATCQRIFDPFFTTKPLGKGTGMGLALSYQIVVEKQGGRLQCVSRLGQGAEFILHLPMRMQA
ncbi:MAG: GAF domain-containing sensor histidine kinase [Phormidium tanganyikae FI6-MK23]|jgi:signal transduction histidine kinase|nr:GAF domain-containing sensor histidine kinase [Phormidium tanganyikae FI6-MK23]